MDIILGGEPCFFSEEHLINWFLAKLILFLREKNLALF